MTPIRPRPTRTREASCSLLLPDSRDPVPRLAAPFLLAGIFDSEHRGRENASGQAKEKKKIAIVEDEPQLLSTYSTLLKGLGYHSIYVFTSGEAFILAVSAGSASPDLVIMDYRLPGMDGIEAAKRVAALRPEVKIVIATADDSVRRQSRVLGYSFLQKPFSLKQLLRILAIA